MVTYGHSLCTYGGGGLLYWSGLRIRLTLLAMLNMRTVLILICALAGVSQAAPVVGQSVIYRKDSTHSFAAVVTYVHGDATADLAVLNGDAYSFGFGPSSWYTWPNGSAVQFDATHDTFYRATVKISGSITLVTGAAGHVDLICDASSTPTAIVDTAQLELTGTLVVGVTLASSMTQSLTWRVPAAYYCKLATGNDTGTPTYTLVRQVKQTLGN